MARRRGEAAGSDDPRAHITSVADLLERDDVEGFISEHSRPVVVDAIRETLDGVRARGGAETKARGADEIVGLVRAALTEGDLDRLRPVVNATGILLHTNLGRAVLPQEAVDALGRMSGCCNLQIDIATGGRGKRNFTTEQLLCRLTGAEGAMVVTNNAAATLLILTVFAAGREVVISRGQLIEIGGSFRLPDCIQQSGATMVEVGTTNKTHLRDYERALSENTGIVLRVNPSNYRVVGFTKEVSIGEMASLKKGREGFLVVDDLGCGALIDLSQYGLPKEPTVPESIAAGADLACFSGDKLIGGPQAGIIVGRADLIAQLKKHPLTRMLRVGKLTDMALQETLRLFLDPATLIRKNPTLRMLTTPAATLKRRAVRLQKKIKELGGGIEAIVEPSESAMGGGALPATAIPTFVLALSSPRHSADELSALLRRNEPPVVGRIDDDHVLLDMRTLLDGEDAVVADALRRIGTNQPEKE